MPKRDEGVEPEKTGARPARASRTEGAERPARAPRAEAVAPAVAPPVEKATGTKKFILVEKTKKFFDTIDKKLNLHVHQMMERVVEDAEKNKNNVVFVTFSTEGCTEEDEVDDEVNIEMIKKVLFAYHTMPDKINTGKAFMIEVLVSDEDAPHILVVQEF
jgi:hypothetical protein